MTRRTATFVSAAVCLVISLAVYLRTLSPAIAFVDSGELTVAAARFGIPHPPGFPLWVLITHLFTLIPIRSIAWRANFASAACAAAAAALMALLVAEMLRVARTGSEPRGPKSKPKRRTPSSEHGAPVEESPLVIALAAAFAGLLLAFSRTLWAYATLTEVYTLNVAMIVAVFASLLHWRRNGDDRWLYLAAILFGAALGDHHVTVGLTLPAIAFLVVRTRGLRILASRQFVICLVLALAAVALVYAYEPIASARKPLLDWGGTARLNGFVDHVTGKQYRRDITTVKAGGQIAFVATLLGRELGPRWFPAALLAALAGAAALWRRDRDLLTFFALVAAADLAWVMAYPIVDDQDAYCLTTIIAIVALAAFGIAAVLRRPAWIAIALVVPGVACATAFPLRDRSDYYVAPRLVANTLRPVKPGALILTNHWNFISPFMYLQNLEGLRRDVDVVIVGMLEWPWYLDQLERQRPELMASVRPQLAAFRPWAEKWEALAGTAEWTPESQSEYDRTYNELLVAMATERLSHGRPVYATREYLVADAGDELRPSAAALEARYDIIPLGLVAEYVPRGSVPRLPPLQLDLRGLNDGTILYEPRDVMERVVDTYARDYRMYGRFAFVVTKQPDLAYAAYRAAMELQPDNAAIARELAKFGGK